MSLTGGEFYRKAEKALSEMDFPAAKAYAMRAGELGVPADKIFSLAEVGEFRQNHLTYLRLIASAARPEEYADAPLAAGDYEATLGILEEFEYTFDLSFSINRIPPETRRELEDLFFRIVKGVREKKENAPDTGGHTSKTCRRMSYNFAVAEIGFMELMRWSLDCVAALATDIGLENEDAPRFARKIAASYSEKLREKAEEAREFYRLGFIGGHGPLRR